MRNGYTFIGWAVEGTSDIVEFPYTVTDNVTFVAQYERVNTSQPNVDDEDDIYTVTFLDYDDTFIDAQDVEAGDDADAPIDPERDGFVFVGWDIDFTNVQSDLTVRALYTPQTTIEENPTPLDPTVESFTVTFVRPDGTVLGTDTVFEGQDATAPTNTDLDGFVFTGWDTDFTNVQEDLTVTAIYVQVPVIAEIEDPEVPLAPGPVVPEEDEEETFTVTFEDHDGNILSEQVVTPGTDADAPVDPTRDGHDFTGWDRDFTNVQEDLVVTAQYAETVEIEDGETPLGNNVIEDEPTPLGTIELGGNGRAWSLFDLLCTVLTTVAALIYLFNRRKKEDEEANESDDEEQEKNRRRKFGKLIGAILSVVSIVLLIITQDFTAPMAIFDKYSLWFALIVVSQTLQIFVTNKEKKEDEESMNA